MTYEQILKKFLKAYNCAITINAVSMPNGLSSLAYIGYVFNGKKCVYTTPLFQMRSSACLDVLYRMFDLMCNLALGVDDLPHVEFSSPEELEMKLSVIGVI